MIIVKKKTIRGQDIGEKPLNPVKNRGKKPTLGIEKIT